MRPMSGAITILGFGLIALSLYKQHVAERHILGEWRRSDPDAWAGKMRHTRRAFPFNLMQRSRVLENDRREWMMQTPDWARDSPVAQRWLKRYRWWLFLMPVGVLVAILPALLQP